MKLNRVIAAVGVIVALPVVAHHSFSIFNHDEVKTFTGVVTRVNPDANHLQIFFAPMNAERKNVERDADGKPLVWAVEMTGSANAAAQGISVTTFAPGTIFSVSLNPLRSGEKAGARVGNMFLCPAKKPPAPGKHCDTVEGNVAKGNGPLVPAAGPNNYQ